MITDNATLISVFKEDLNDDSFVVPDYITTIKTKAFQNCENLKTLVIPNTVLNIETRAFYNCKELTNLTIGEDNLQVKYIGHHCNIIKSTKKFDINVLYKVDVILNKKEGLLNLIPKFLAVIDEYTMYADTAREAYFNLTNKIFYTPIEKRLNNISFESGKKYKAKDFYKTFFILTNNCELGLKEFIQSKDINLEDEMTLEEFINLCQEVPRGKIVEFLKK